MGAAFAGIVRAPMTSVMMILETTRDYTVIVPLMIANLVSFFISSRLQREPIYIALATQDGIHLPTLETRKERRQFMVGRAMTVAPELLPAYLSAGSALERVQLSALHAWPVIEGRDVVGVVSLATLESACAQGDSSKPLAALLDSHPFPHAHADQGLDQALAHMGAAHVDVLPVVGRGDVNHLQGVITLKDTLDAFGIRIDLPGAGEVSAIAVTVAGESSESQPAAERDESAAVHR